MTELCDRTGTELSAALRDGEISSVALAESAIARREALDDRVAAFLTPTPEVALERAEAFDTYLATGAPQSGVAGMPPHRRTSSPRRASERRAARRSSTTTCRPTTRRPGPGCRAAARCSSARRTATSSPWAPRTRTRRSVLHNPWALETVPGGSSGAARRRSRAACPCGRSAPTPAVRCVSPPRSAASSG